jgi:mono/diheme cytochrome c family protein
MMMTLRTTSDRLLEARASSVAIGVALAAAALLCVPAAGTAQDEHPEYHLYAAEDFGIDPTEVTFNKHIAPILERSCVQCHNVGGAAPMAYTSYQDVRRYARRIREKTAIRDRMGAMPPWYAEKDIGIQHYLQDPSLTDLELALIQAWADNGTPEGDPADLTAQLDVVDETGWTIEPDLMVESG